MRRAGASAYRLLYSGRLLLRKQLVPFVGVLRTWCLENPSRTVEMWFAGDGPERGPLQRLPLAQNLSLKFLGNLNCSDLPGIYEQCGALVIATLADEWALVANEALAAGMPVLGSTYS